MGAPLNMFWVYFPYNEGLIKMEKKEFFPNNYMYLGARFLFLIFGPCIILYFIRGFPIYVLFLGMIFTATVFYLYSNRVVIDNEYITGPGDESKKIKISLKDAQFFFKEPKGALYTAFLPIELFIISFLAVLLIRQSSTPLVIPLPCPCQLPFFIGMFFVGTIAYKLGIKNHVENLNPKELLFGSIVIREKNTPKEISLPYVTFTQNTIEEMKGLLHVQ